LPISAQDDVRAGGVTIGVKLSDEIYELALGYPSQAIEVGGTGVRDRFAESALVDGTGVDLDGNHPSVAEGDVVCVAGNHQVPHRAEGLCSRRTLGSSTQSEMQGHGKITLCVASVASCGVVPTVNACRSRSGHVRATRTTVLRWPTLKADTRSLKMIREHALSASMCVLTYHFWRS